MGDTIFTNQVPVNHNSIDGTTTYTLGTLFFSDIDGQINGIRWWTPQQGGQPGRLCALYQFQSDTAGILLKQANFVTTVDDAWNYTPFDAPVSIVANQLYIACIYTPNYYTSTNGLFNVAMVNGHLTAPATGTHPNGRFKSNSGLAYPTSGYQGTGYFVDVDFTPNGGPTAVPLFPGGVNQISIANLALFNGAANGSGPVWDSDAYYGNVLMTVVPAAGVSAYSVQLQGSLDGVNFINIGFPVTSGGVLGTTIGPVTQTTGKFATWSGIPFRYFQASLASYAGSGNVNVQLACA